MHSDEEIQIYHKKEVHTRFGIKTSQTIRRNPQTSRWFMPQKNWDQDYSLGTAVLQLDQLTTPYYGRKKDLDKRDEREKPVVVAHKQGPLCPMCKHQHNKHSEMMEKLARMKSDKNVKRFDIIMYERNIVELKKDCQQCRAMETYTLEHEIPIEKIDKRENKRMARKGKEIPERVKIIRKSSEESDEEEKKGEFKYKYEKVPIIDNKHIIGVRNKKQVLEAVQEMKMHVRSDSLGYNSEDDQRSKKLNKEQKALLAKHPDPSRLRVVRAQHKHIRQYSSGKTWNLEGLVECKREEQIELKKIMKEDANAYKYFEDI
ncbi:hypothetical protein FGO68_gene6879 [Halteria grandinella]|uniref:Uncharacterized protein n=1 Tax=Halteria grandinella TaxID=5974 RepID=A0A8J8NL36_HALGN|nr:hypothetical protein FGO68_gene6879 [Halteria grandinella]